eukprot:1192894-Prorocentrum_minimum.AAC.4
MVGGLVPLRVGFKVRRGGVVWSSEDAQRATTPTKDRESRCAVHKGGTWFASLHRLPTTEMPRRDGVVLCPGGMG